MQFSKYVWELYKQSKQGKKSIKTYSTLTFDILKKKFGLDDVEFEIDKKRDKFETDTALFNITKGERNYPDYAFGANPKRGEESAKMILEVKYQIGTRRELTDAYYQAKSYALRLQTKVLALASKEGVWIYPYKKDNFDFDNFTHRNWNELSHPDVLHEVGLKIGKKKVLG
ncbi:MAG TPA: hypothetical protein VLB01_06730 [Thermodesulfobacteriota bacterium]|nr:hypothetical protein [Thermodesulfobacteriota bacterium]